MVKPTPYVPNPNPYAAPTETISPPTGDTSIFIDEVRVRENGFSGSALSGAEVAQTMRQELSRYSAELGFQVAETDAGCRVAGELVRVEQGSRMLRMLVPGVFGAVKVEGNFRITKNGNTIKELYVRQRKAAGFQGGNTRALLELCLRQIALQVGSEVGVATGRIDASQSVRASWYLYRMAAVAALIAAALAGIAFAWAINQPVRMDGLEGAAKPWWACVVFLFLFATVFMLGLATAPTDVLKSRTLLSLRSVSGVKTIGAQRIVITLLTIAPIVLLLLTFAVL